MNIPNSITLARLFMVPFAVYAILEGQYVAAFWIFIVAGLSDGVDGYLAKRLGQQSRLGACLDPIADKTLLVATFLALGYIGWIPLWLIMLVVFRDLMIVGGVAVLYLNEKTVDMTPHVSSKLNTVSQIALIGVLLGELSLGIDADMFNLALIYIIGATTLASGAAYVAVWSRDTVELGGQQT